LSAPWQDRWFEHAARRQLRAWRGVEAQHAASTMRLVDTLDEQAVLEAILDASKPPLPPEAQGLHPLLAGPFRYRPRHAGRFRRPGGRGVWYGAASLRTACAEVAYWRWRFVSDSDGLRGDEVMTAHTFFQARVRGTALDLLAAPWSASHAHWAHPADYTATQALADAAVARGVQWIRYASVRDPGGVCAAVFDAAALVALDAASLQTWHCRATAAAVRLVNGDQRFEWHFDAA